MARERQSPTDADAGDATTATDATAPDLDDLGFAPSGGWNAIHVDGEWRAQGDRAGLDVVDPTTRTAVGTVPAGTDADVNAAYAAAESAQREWADRPPEERASVVADARELVGEYRDEFAHLFAVECGGSRLKAEIELDLTAGTMEVAEGLADAADPGDTDEYESVVEGKRNLVFREPAGVVGVISPWNFPLYLSMRAVAPALALGNAVVLKPSTHTAVVGGLALASLFEEAGLPDGVLNVVTGEGSAIGETVAGHPAASVVSFTGSTEVGRRVGATAAEQLSLPALELGGNNAHVVTADADLDRAVDGGVFGSFTHQGQECISINRHLVHESLYDEYVERLAERAERLPVGDPRDEAVLVGPVQNESQFETIADLVERSVERGAEIEAGGEFYDWFVEPTVLSGVTNEMPIAAEEHFGPVAPVIPFSDDEEAVEMANDTEYGLSGSVHCEDTERAIDIARRLDTGMVHVNDQPLNDEPHVAFGGVNASGVGRYNGEWIAEELTETRWISVQEEARDYPY
ncbi:aldehyde dehydrogenase family protein [Halorussus gelatinilyticus]|uniref:Aldehyde dehydrogenase family protein n=1 Tax=Halorussus gelatinilyticus TaxID=2937524 RepID=A0A8U0IIR4_9EURY|nr:aldehyde dehydrogenase family protein [Halorussus gelatinilyticus]UPW00585.1 aldehyde dehydrogenase family protein [Halorussus gelatinilyticus]